IPFIVPGIDVSAKAGTASLRSGLTVRAAVARQADVTRPDMHPENNRQTYAKRLFQAEEKRTMPRGRSTRNTAMLRRAASTVIEPLEERRLLTTLIQGDSFDYRDASRDV